ncbi:ATP-binding protein [Micromonospora echinofusca]|uniref:ATP-binding protein n=1 Tax=Micromonospora echinofusca TaxID=47858 RepID=UPI003F772A90
MVVPHHPRGARLARHRLADELTGVVPPDLLADLVAVLAELVGNAVRHAEPLPGAVVRVAWRVGPAAAGAASVQIRVTDGGAVATPRIRAAGPTAADGRGLHIVAALADRWGVERDGLGQSVWAEFSAATPGGVGPDVVAAGLSAAGSGAGTLTGPVDA